MPKNRKKQKQPQRQNAKRRAPRPHPYVDRGTRLSIAQTSSRSFTISYPAIYTIPACNADANTTIAIALPVTNRFLGTTTTGRLADFARVFQQVTLKSLSASYIPALGANTTGTLIGAFDGDGTASNSTLEEIGRMDGSDITPVAARPSAMEPQTWYWRPNARTRLPISTELEGGVARNFGHEAAIYFVARAEQCPTAAAIGTIVFHATYEFARPK